MTGIALEVLDPDPQDESRPARRIRLSNTDDIAVEIARVYRDARTGRIKAAEGTKLVFMLTMLAKVKQGDFERRLEDLERLLAQQGTKP